MCLTSKMCSVGGSPDQDWEPLNWDISFVKGSHIGTNWTNLDILLVNLETA